MISHLVMVLAVFMTLQASAFAPPAPQDPAHPGSRVYQFGFETKTFKCLNRDVTVYVPTTSTKPNEFYPVVVYGHGQALGLEHYADTFEHLAKKGVAVVFPMYDKGFFDQEWTRMGRDYVNVTDCALKQFPQVSPEQIVFSGHSKGAYVAAIATGLATRENLSLKPKATLVFQAAGYDAPSAGSIASDVALTVVFSDRDTVVERNFSQSLFRAAPSLVKQFILIKSYPADGNSGALEADHYWPQTKRAIFGGGPPSALHYYGAWKWLVAAAQDLQSGAKSNNSFLYGADAIDKGVANLTDEVIRSW